MTAHLVDPCAQAARRARVIAGIARDRFADGRIRTALLGIAAHLDAAAAHLDTAARLDAATRLDPCAIRLDAVAGVGAVAAGPGVVPPGVGGEPLSAAVRELFCAEQVAVDHPAARFPAELGQYVLHALTGGRALPFPHPLRPLNHPFVKREADLLHALHLLHHDTTLMTEAPGEWLRQVFTIWQQHARLTDVIRADRARPHSRP
ncbi:hypothetical protein [Streptomyces flaveolus]|uniref:hypothetical protein n=1 Tax=Streptomyces flaveolus TaxID=67297 RepID=UPI00331896BE